LLQAGIGALTASGAVNPQPTVPTAPSTTVNLQDQTPSFSDARSAARQQAANSNQRGALANILSPVGSGNTLGTSNTSLRTMLGG
jgi:hypothetical protein